MSRRLGLLSGRRSCAATLHRVLTRLEVVAFERAVASWLARTGVTPQDLLALDGQTLRGVHGADVPGVHLVSAYAYQAQVILAQLRTEGKGQEIAATKEMLAGLSLEERMVTAVALLTQREVYEQIVEVRGDYFLPVKDNQPALVATFAAPFPPLLARAPDPTVAPTLPIWQQRQWQERGATLTIAVDAPVKAQHGRCERRILWALADPGQNVRTEILAPLASRGPTSDNAAGSSASASTRPPARSRPKSLTPLPACWPTRRMPLPYWPSPGAIGASRISSITSAMPRLTKIAAKSAPAPHQRPSPSVATSPSPSSGAAMSSTSPPCALIPVAPTAPSTWSSPGANPEMMKWPCAMVERLLALGRVCEAATEAERADDFALLALANLFVQRGHFGVAKRLVRAPSAALIHV